MGWQVTQRAVYEWLESGPDPDLREALLAFLPDLVATRERDAAPVPGNHAPVYERVVPETNLVVTFLVADQFKTIDIINIGPVEPDRT